MKQLLIFLFITCAVGSAALSTSVLNRAIEIHSGDIDNCLRVFMNNSSFTERVCMKEVANQAFESILGLIAESVDAGTQDYAFDVVYNYYRINAINSYFMDPFRKESYPIVNQCLAHVDINSIWKLPVYPGSIVSLNRFNAFCAEEIPNWTSLTISNPLMAPTPIFLVDESTRHWSFDDNGFNLLRKEDRARHALQYNIKLFRNQYQSGSDILLANLPTGKFSIMKPNDEKIMSLTVTDEGYFIKEEPQSPPWWQFWKWF